MDIFYPYAISHNKARTFICLNVRGCYEQAQADIIVRRHLVNECGCQVYRLGDSFLEHNTHRVVGKIKRVEYKEGTRGIVTG